MKPCPTFGGNKPRCRSTEDVDAALRELSWCEAEQARIDGECDKEVSDVKQKYRTRCAVTIDEQQTTLADRVQKLRDAISLWAETDGNLKHLLSKGDKRSFDFTHGTVGYRKMPGKLGFAEGFNEASVIEYIDRRCPFLKRMRTILETLWKGFPLSTFITFKPQLSLTGAYNACKGGGAAQMLKDVGLVETGGDDRLVITPAKYAESDLAA